MSACLLDMLSDHTLLENFLKLNEANKDHRNVYTTNIDNFQTRLYPDSPFTVVDAFSLSY